MHRSPAEIFLCVSLVAFQFAVAPAAGVTLSFDDATCDGGQPCSDTLDIDPQYGDIPGVLDVIYDRDLGNPLVGPLTFWESGYGSLQGVAFGAGIASDQAAEVYLAPLRGGPVTLVGFDFGAWRNRSLETQVTILDGDGGELWSSGQIVVDNVTHFDFDLTSESGIRIRWGPTAYFVAIDNLQFDVVPEPSTLLQLATALGAIILSARRNPYRIASQP